jgi:hypothetical protein
MPEAVVIVTAALTIAVSAIKTGRATYSLIQGLRDAPSHIEELSSHLSTFNAILASLHAVIAQEASKLDHDPITIGLLETLPTLLNGCEKVMNEARAILEPISRDIDRHQGLRAVQWEVYRKGELAGIARRLQDYVSTITLGFSALTRYDTSAQLCANANFEVYN